MKITDIRFAMLRVPLKTPFKTALRTVDTVEDIVALDIALKRNERDRNYLFMHPADAAARGIGEGDPVRIRSRDGAFAEFLSLPPQNLFTVPNSVSDRQAVFTEPLAAACEILDQVAIRATHRVAVIGDGKLGQLIARVLATTGCNLTLIGKHADKLELAAKAGINRTVLFAAFHSDYTHLNKI